MSEKTTLHERALDDAANEVILERWRHPRGPAMTIPEQAVEAAAEKIYERLPYHGPGEKPAWVPRGNSLKQDEARRFARAALEAALPLVGVEQTSALDLAWEKINALGGAKPSTYDDFGRGIIYAVAGALEIIEELGGSNPAKKRAFVAEKSGVKS